jgi:hypothetical protein
LNLKKLERFIEWFLCKKWLLLDHMLCHEVDLRDVSLNIPASLCSYTHTELQEGRRMGCEAANTAPRNLNQGFLPWWRLWLIHDVIYVMWLCPQKTWCSSTASNHKSANQFWAKNLAAGHFSWEKLRRWFFELFGQFWIWWA